ncbi:MAG: AraC family transcriptional regulator, partial [Mesorhizobium sp.]
MTTVQRTLASGSGWQVSDVVCTAAAGDRPFEEEHRGFCVAAVTSGTFRYRTRQGTAMLAPGAILLGNPGACYECGHEHGAGDRCLSFHFSPAYLEPPLPSLAPLLAEAEAARERSDNGAFEELGLRLAGAVVAAAAGSSRTARAPSRRDQKRVAEAVRLIELNAERPLSL